MGEIKPWQAVLFVVAIVVLGGSLAWGVFGGQKIEFADKMYLLDVPTGDLYYADISGRRGVSVPAKHPDTLERTLIPINEVDGTWEIGERYRSSVKWMVDKLDVTPSDVIDPGSWEVASVSKGSAKKYISPWAN